MSYIKLVKARNSNLANDIIDYDGEDTVLLDSYVTATDEEGYEEVYADITELDIAGNTVVEVVLVMGSGDGDTRCYCNEVEVVVDNDGNIWMHESKYEEVFC